MKNIRGVLRFILAGLGAVALVLPWAACSDPFGEYNNSNDPNFSAGTVTTVFVVIPTPVTGPVIQTVLGNGSMGNPGVDQNAQDAKITAPTGLSIPGDGNVYVALRGSGSMNQSFIVKIPAMSTSTSKVNRVIGGGNIICTSPQTVATIMLNSSSGVSVFGSQIFVADTSVNRILKAEALIIDRYAGTGSSTMVEGTSDRLTSDIGFVPDLLYSNADGGALYYVEYNTHRVRKIVGNFVTNVAGTFNQFGFSNTKLNLPQSIAMGPGPMPGFMYLYIADTNNNVIKRVEGSTMVIVAGTDTEGNLLVEGASANSTPLSRPHGVAVDQVTGDIYIADTGNHRILKVKPDGKISIVAGIGQPGFSGDSGHPRAAKLNFPERLAVARIDNKVVLYISDTGNNRVRRIIF